MSEFFSSGCRVVKVGEEFSFGANSANFVYENAVNGLLKRETDLIQSQIEQRFGVQIDKQKLTHITDYERLRYLTGFIDGYNARVCQAANERKETK